MKTYIKQASIGMALAAVFLAASCQTAQKETEAGVSTAMTRTTGGFEDALLSPLVLLNLRRTPIPPLLEQLRSPYEPVAELSCAAIARDVTALTAILGPDADAPSEKTSTGEQAGDAAADAALGAVESAVTGFIPYQSILKSASGASRHETAVREAYARGAARRAYLKGIGASKGCPAPAAPDPAAGVAPAEAT